MILFYLLVTVMPMIRHPLWTDIVGDLTVIKYLGIACLVYAVFYLPSRETPPPIFATWQARFFVAFALLVIGLFLAYGDPLLPFEISPLMSFASFLVFLFLTLTVVDSLHRLRWVLLMAVGSVAYASLHVLREWQKYGDMAAGYRPGWVTGDPNYYSISALLCVPLAIYLLRTEQPRWERWFCIGSIVVTVLGLTFAASRGGFVGMAVGAIVMAVHAKHRLRTLAIVLVATLPLMVIAPSSPLSRIFSPDIHDTYSADHRMALAAAGLEIFQLHPLTGVGPGNFKDFLQHVVELDEYHVAHNSYVEVMAEMGLPGILLFLAAIIATFVSLERVRRASASGDPPLIARTAEALEVGLAAFLAAAFFVSAEAHRLFWFMIFLSTVLPPLAERSRASAPGKSPEAPRRSFVQGSHRIPLLVLTSVGCLLGDFAMPSHVAAQSVDALPALDEHGGYKSLPIAGKASGFFRVEKLGNRWVFVTPEGHAFWLRAVYGVDITDGGASYIENLKKKYNDPSYIPWWPYVGQAAKRLKAWGFNAFGEYSSQYVFPIGAYGRRETNPEKLPFIRLINPSLYSRQSFGVKDVLFGTDPAVTPGVWRVGGFPDVFDPAFERAARHFARDEEAFPRLEVLTKAGWLIGTSMDDRDYLFGFGAIRELGGWHMHLGWMAAASAPSQTRNPEVWRGATKGVSYADTKLYTKYAFRDFLREKYQTVEALNAAWTAKYTTWDSDGGWPRGAGVLDESGRNPWMGKDFYSLKDSAPRVKADLDEWVGKLADRYFSVVAAAIRAGDPNHLVFSPAALSTRAHPKVLEAAGRHCDVLQVEGPWDSDTMYERAYGLAKRPLFIWTTFMSHSDSPLASTKLSGWESVNFPTQEARGQAYASFVRRIVTFRTSDGTYPFVGLDWWAWTDKITGGESNNFGLVTNKDNAYDGKEAVTTAGKDTWGYPTGSEARNHGDFLSFVRRAHEEVFSALKSQLAASMGRK